jgi:hypothetical protein
VIYAPTVGAAGPTSSDTSFLAPTDQIRASSSSLEAPRPALCSVVDGEATPLIQLSLRHHPRSTFSHQVAFTENCNCREVVLVRVIAPGAPVKFPRASA